MKRGLLFGVTLLFGALPSTSNYRLNSYGFGSGGTAGSSTATYSLEGNVGEPAGSSTATTTAGLGFIHTEQANVPTVSLSTDGGLDYNKLHLTVSPDSHDPTDTKYLVAVTTTTTSNMNTAGSVQYVQPDGTLSSSLSLSDYQTATTWTASNYIIGLLPSTTYYVAARSTQGKFTESAYGPVVSQATAAPSLTFGLVTSNQSAPPFSINLGTLQAGNIASSAQTINTSLTTNAASGGNIYIGGKNGGLLSSATGYKINAVSSDLASVSEGFGAQSTSATQSSGGPFTVISPFNGAGNIVGLVSPTLASLYSSNAPVSGGAGVLVVKAKAASKDVAASDYQEVLTFVASGNF
ncbi:MAG TPA: hypothetical protein VG992_04690 [Candidatus Saccharimonadales bacterium]|nr:hypothetical protein [Candidatus Saccharimonadales bacterium]